MFQYLVLLGLLCQSALVSGIPVDNGIAGDAEIECGPSSIAITFNTQNNFGGKVYIKGLSQTQPDECMTLGDNRRAVGQITLPFDSPCNMERRREVNPKGIFVSATVVISFHPFFLTKVDRAFTIQCFYMEADKTVDAEIEVSMVTLGAQTQTVPMPVCRYEIRDGPEPDADLVQYASVGQSVFHNWVCDSETTNTFCMKVYSCFVRDGAGGSQLDLLDDQGCAIDIYLMGNLEYSEDLAAQREVHVFKYADRPALFFQCQIEIAVKEPNGDCSIELQPTCSEPDGQGDGQRIKRKRRAMKQTDYTGLDTTVVDVVTRMHGLDIQESASSSPDATPNSSRIRASPSSITPNRVPMSPHHVCVSPFSLGVSFVSIILLILFGVTWTTCLCTSHNSKIKLQYQI